MSKYDKEVDSRTPEFDEAIEPLEKATHEVPPPPRDHQQNEREENRDPRQ